MRCQYCGTSLEDVALILSRQGSAFSFCPSCGHALPTAMSLEVLLQQLKGELWALEKKLASYGISAEPHDIVRAEQLRAQIESLCPEPPSGPRQTPGRR